MKLFQFHCSPQPKHSGVGDRGKEAALTYIDSWVCSWKQVLSALPYRRRQRVSERLGDLPGVTEPGRPEPGFTTRSSQRWHLHSFQHTAQPHSMIWGHTLSRVFRDHPSPKLHWGNVVLQRHVIYPQWLRRYQQNRSWNVTLWPPGQALGALHPHFLRLSLKGQRTSNK